MGTVGFIVKKYFIVYTKTHTMESSDIVVGKNAADNWEIIRNSEEDHWWLHLNSFPSPHVIFRGRDIDDDIVSEASRMCKEKSKYKNLRNVKVVYTRVSNLRLTNVVGEVEFVSKKKCNFITI